MMNKNIVILCIENGSPSGVVRYIQMLTEGLENQTNIKTHIICLNTNLIFPELKVVEGRFIANLPYSSMAKPLKDETYWLAKYFGTVSDLLIPYLKNMEQVIWHVQELILVKLAYLLKLSLGGYVLTHLHIIPWKFNIEYNENHFKALYSQWIHNIFTEISNNRLENIAYPLSDKIICVSYSAMKHLVSVYNINPKRISVIYNGLNKIKIPLKRKKTFPELLFVGRVSREKGVINLLNALNIVNYRGYVFNLKLVGQCTTQMATHIHKTYKKLNIELLGAVSFDQLKDIYSKSTIGIVPSLHEQCSYVAIEMSMFGLPTIVSDVDALSEMFEDNINALKIPLIFDEDFGLQLDEERLADAIIRLINDKALRQKLSINAIKNYNERFTLENMIQNTINLYKQIIEEHNA